MDEYVTNKLMQKCEEDLKDLVAPKCLDDVLMKLENIFKETAIDDEKEQAQPKTVPVTAKAAPFNDGEWVGDIYFDKGEYHIGSEDGPGGPVENAKGKLLIHLLYNIDKPVPHSIVQKITGWTTLGGAGQLKSQINNISKSYYIDRKTENKVTYYTLTERDSTSS